MTTNQSDVFMPSQKLQEAAYLEKKKRKKRCLQTWSITVTPDYLSQVACHFDVVPAVVIEFSIDWLDDGLKGPGTQIDDEGNCPIFQRQVDVVCGFPRVEQQAVALPGLEGQRDLVAAALNGVLR